MRGSIDMRIRLALLHGMKEISDLMFTTAILVYVIVPECVEVAHAV